MGIPRMHWNPSWTATISRDPATGRTTVWGLPKTQRCISNEHNHYLRATVRDMNPYPLSPDSRQCCANDRVHFSSLSHTDSLIKSIAAHCLYDLSDLLMFREHLLG
jgi:hypothetical protein